MRQRARPGQRVRLFGRKSECHRVVCWGRLRGREAVAVYGPTGRKREQGYTYRWVFREAILS